MKSVSTPKAAAWDGQYIMLTAQSLKNEVMVSTLDKKGGGTYGTWSKWESYGGDVTHSPVPHPTGDGVFAREHTSAMSKFTPLAARVK